MTGFITCVDCGVEVERGSNRQERCGDCAGARKRLRSRALYRRDHSKLHTITCVDCGIDVERKGPGHKRCPAHAEAARRRSKREWDRRDYAANASARNSSAREWRARNPDKIRARSRAYRVRNSAKVRELRTIGRKKDAAIDANRNGERWTMAEDAIVASWAHGRRELASALGRTVRAVDARLGLLRRQGMID